MNGSRSPDRSKLSVHRIHDFLAHRCDATRIGDSRGVLDHGKGDGKLAFQSIGDAHDRNLGDARMRLHRLLDLARAQPMAGDVDHVVGAPEHEIVTICVTRRPVEG